MGFSDPDLLRVRGDDLQILEYFRLQSDGVDQLVNWLVSALQAPDDSLKASAIHGQLAAMTLSPVMYTTNYDDFLERSFELLGRPAMRVATEQHVAQRLSRAHTTVAPCEIVKFHGDLNTHDSMVLTESDYQTRLRLESAMDLRLRSDLLGRAVLFLGYSFRDPNVSYIFRLVNDTFKDLPESDYGRRAFIAVPDPSKFERDLFRNRRITVIGLDSGRVSEDLAELLAQVQA